MRTLRMRLLTTLAMVALVATACSSSPSPSAEPSSTAPVAEPSFTAPSESEPVHEEEPTIAFTAASATITVDGDSSDWSAIEGATVNMEQLRLENLTPEGAAEI